MPKDDYSPYMKVLGDLELMLEKKMLEDKLHYKQHDKMKDMDYDKKEKKEEKAEYKDEDTDMDYVKEYMKGNRKKKDTNAARMIAMSSKSKKPPSKKGRGKKRA